MLRNLSLQLTRCVEASYSDPVDAACQAVRVLMAASGAANGYVVLGARRKGRPKQNEVCPLKGHRAIFYRRARPLPAKAVRIIDAFVASGAYVEDPMTVATVANGHRLWAARLREVASPEIVRAYLQSPLCRALGFSDAIRATVPLGKNALVVFGLDGTRARFGPEACDRVLEILPALEPPLRRLGMFHGIVEGRQVLSPREIDVYRALIAGLAEKEIAARLGITPNRAHELAAEVFRKLQVSGRSGLWRHWLAGARVGADVAAY